VKTEQDMNDVQKVAAQIKRYIRNRPNAADSLQGIATWWLRQQKIEENFQLVEEAVTLLLAQGVIKKRTLRVGEDLYFVSAVKSDD